MTSFQINYETKAEAKLGNKLTIADGQVFAEDVNFFISYLEMIAETARSRAYMNTIETLMGKLKEIKIKVDAIKTAQAEAEAKAKAELDAKIEAKWAAAQAEAAKQNINPAVLFLMPKATVA